MEKRNESIKDFCEKLHQTLYEREDFIESYSLRKLDDGFNNYCIGAVMTLIDVHYIIDKTLKELVKG